MTGKGVGRVGGGIEQLGRRTQTWTTVWWLQGGGSIRGIKGNGKNTIKKTRKNIKEVKKRIPCTWFVNPRDSV